jgi:hypothetical protein
MTTVLNIFQAVQNHIPGVHLNGKNFARKIQNVHHMNVVVSTRYVELKELVEVRKHHIYNPCQKSLARVLANVRNVSKRFVYILNSVLQL